MLAQSEVCAGCGKVHAGRRFGFLGATQGECPLVVFGSLPSLTSPSDFEDSSSDDPMPEFSSLRIDYTRPEPPLPSPIAPRKTSMLTVPWPMPSHLEDYL